ncbi:MAG: choice-of-anchor D domain-containing protein, partial [Candidatus Cloacimonadaceae bacterium]|nr:choice-of-anchor D domain-containing protein [Candidatus Cloacimonadaceae bacterium]
WNGGTLTVYVNGSAVLSGVTLPSGSGPATFPFEVNNGDQITTLYSPGSWSYENEYYIYDHNGALIASQGVGNTVPNSITTPIIVVAPTGGPGSVTNPSPASGSGNVAFDGNLSWTFGADSETYDLWFGPTGSMVQVVTGAAAGATGSYPFAGLSSFTQYSWRVIIHNTNRATTNGPVWTFTTAFGPGYVQIGTGTASQIYPFYIGWGFTRSMSLYTSAQMGPAGLLDQVAWNVATVSTVPVPYKIYARTVTEETLTAQTWADFVASATLLEQGTHTFATTGWNNFVLDTPYVYAGGSLVIGVEANYGGYGTGPTPYFYYTAAATNVHQNWYADSTPPTGNGNINTSLPNVMLHLSPLGGDPNLSINPPSWNFGSLTPGGTATKQFTLTNIGGGTVNVSNISVTGAYYSLTVNPAPVGLGSTQSAYFTVQYAPTAMGTHAGNVAITDDRGRMLTNIPLSGNAALSVNMQNGSATLAVGDTWNFYDSGGPANTYSNYEDYTYTFN